MNWKSGRYGQNLAGEWPNSQGFWGVWFRLFVKSGCYGQIWQWNLEWVLANQGGVGRIWKENGPIPRVFGGSGSGFLSNQGGMDRYGSGIWSGFG